MRPLFFTFIFAASMLPGTMAADLTEESESTTGSWRWSFTMPDGSTVEPRAKLKQQGESLTGTTKFRDGFDVAIEDGRVEQNQVSFAVRRERNKQEVTTTYTGLRTGDRIEGTIETDWRGQKQTFPWHARRSSRDPAGIWSWRLANRRSQTNEFKLELQREGEKLSGTFTAFGVDTEIEDGTFKDGEISFTVARESGDDVIVSEYRGRVAMDLIRGRVEITGSERDRTIEWTAKRVD